MPTLWFFNKQGTKIPKGKGAFDFGKSIKDGSISAEDGLPSYVYSISVRYGIYSRGPRHRPVNYTTLDCATLRTLLENTPRKLGKIQVGCGFFSEPARLSPEYLDFFASICHKAERLEFGLRALTHTAEIECLANGLLAREQQPDVGPIISELHVDLSSFDTPEKTLCLLQLFRSIGESSLDKLEIFNIPDLTDESNLGNLLIESIKVNRSIRTLVLDGYWGHQSNGMVEKVMCAVLEHTQVEDLRVFSRKLPSSEMENNMPAVRNEMTISTFFEKLAASRNLRNLEWKQHNLLLEPDSYLNSLENAISHNTCLERLDLWFGYGKTIERTLPRRYSEKLCAPLAMNRAVRGLSHSTPLGLWPHVLERAGKIRYYSVERKEPRSPHLIIDDWKSPSSELPRADVIYKLLRERNVIG